MFAYVKCQIQAILWLTSKHPTTGKLPPFHNHAWHWQNQLKLGWLFQSQSRLYLERSPSSPLSYYRARFLSNNSNTIFATYFLLPVKRRSLLPQSWLWSQLSKQQQQQQQQQRTTHMMVWDFYTRIYTLSFFLLTWQKAEVLTSLLQNSVWSRLDGWMAGWLHVWTSS